MSRSREIDASMRFSRLPLRAVLCACALVFPAALAVDTVVLRDGSEIEGQVVSLDAGRLVVDLTDGSRKSFARADVQSIEFGEREMPPIKARVMVNESDDEVRLYLDGREIASPGELQAGWIDIAPLLAEGANQITAEVLNQAGTWSYRWTIEAGGQRHVFSCGLRGKTGCMREGGTGQERGTMTAGRAWVYLKRRAGEVKLQAEE